MGFWCGIIMSNAPFDMGRAAAKRGETRKNNPYDKFKRASGSTITHERKASEWEEGYDSVPVDVVKKKS